jgi:hypothetical protein
MQLPIHYVVKSRLIRFTEEGEINFLEFEEKFVDEEPIRAREKAFNYFQNYVDVLLDYKEKKYDSFEQTIEDLREFYNPELIENLYGNKTKLNELEFGIGVFAVIENNEKKSLSTNYDLHDKWPIHGFGDVDGYVSAADDDDYLIISLHAEIDAYRKYGYSTGGKEINIIYCDKFAWETKEEIHPAICSHEILETPLDWTGYDKPYWWLGKNKLEQLPPDIGKLIKNGETNQIEFKPALLYNVKTHRAGIGVKAIIARAICAFLNSNGGYLIIGVDDGGNAQGLEMDFSLSEGKDEKDFFRLEFDQMLQHFLTFSIKHQVNGKFHLYDGKEIFVVEVFPSKRRPIFLNGRDEKEFYVRGEASSRRLIDIEEITNYCIERFTER